MARKTIIVDCDLWNRGNGENPEVTVALLNSHGMCCLGFAMLQLTDATEADITDVGEPGEIGWEFECPDYSPLAHREEYLDAVLGRYEYLVNSEFSESAIAINDDPEIDDRERMKRLRALAREHGLQFRFINQPAS